MAGDYGTLVIGADGSYTFTPNDVLGASETGDDVFTYTADGATATLTITVTGINDAPTALDNSITTNEDTNHVFSTGEFNFSDDDNSGSLNKIKITSLEDNGALQYYNGSTWVDVTENQEITAADITSGYLRFKPDANENGNSYTSFEFQVSDGTAYSSSSSTMTINVTPVNDAPVSSASSVTTNEDTTYTFAADDFNFTDEEGDTLSSVTISALSGSDGTFLLNGAAITDSTTVSKADIDAGLLTFVPDANENGSDYNTFTFTVNDGNDDSGSSTMTVNVTPVNDAPVSSASSVTTNEDTTYTFAADDFNFTDEEGDTLSSVTVSALSGSDGTFLLNGAAITDSTTVSKADIDAGLLTFVPDANENGSDYNTFTFTVNDGNDDSGSSTMTVNVTPVNDAPTARNDTGTINEDAELDVDNSDNLTTVTAASYSDSDSLTIAGSDSSPATTQSHFEDLIFNDDGTKMYTLGYASSVCW